MKKGKKLLAVLLVLVMITGLAACSGFEMKMTRAAKKMEKLQSYRMDMDVDLGLSISILGQSMDLDMGVQGKADVLNDPLKMKMETTVSILGEGIQMLSYTEKTDGALTTYVSADGGKVWAKQSVEAGEEPSSIGVTDFAVLFKLASRFEKTGTETVRGLEATVYSGTVEGEDIKELVESSGVLDRLAESMEMKPEELDLNVEECGSIPVTIAIDNRSGMITRYTMDLTEPMRQMMPLIMDQLTAELAGEIGLEGLDLGMLGLKLDLSQVLAEVELYDFDAVEPFEIPEEARNAADMNEIAAA